jgi:TolA-binding protein
MRLLPPIATFAVALVMCQLHADAAVPQASREHRDKQIAKARERMKLDQKKYTAEQLRECENLYQVANKNWKTPEAFSTLKVMIEKYPDVNRTGCAVLYLAQMSRGKDRETRLKEAIEKYSDCWYLNGAQVGPLARMFLGMYQWAEGDKAAAKKLFDEVREKYPDAISHSGQLLKDVIADIESSVGSNTTPSTTPSK